MVFDVLEQIEIITQAQKSKLQCDYKKCHHFPFLKLSIKKPTQKYIKKIII